MFLNVSLIIEAQSEKKPLTSVYKLYVEILSKNTSLHTI